MDQHEGVMVTPERLRTPLTAVLEMDLLGLSQGETVLDDGEGPPQADRHGRLPARQRPSSTVNGTR